MYDNDQQLDAATTKYINEGLKRNQLCVYASVYMREKTHQERISSLIDNYAKNIAEGNLIVIDSAPYYLAAMTDNFAPFEEIKEQIKSRAACRSDKHVRFADDCVAFLFKNKHFEESSRLEEWGHRKPFEGSYLCPYAKGLTAKYPYNIQKFRILSNHDIIANESGDVIAVYLSEFGRQEH